MTTHVKSYISTDYMGKLFINFKGVGKILITNKTNTF